jgi:hypothetical protein
MDYKIIILILSILVLICTLVYFVLENNATKKLIEDKYKSMIHFIDINIKNIHHKTNTELNKFGNKIKSMNDDCIQKMRKMNALGSQPITNISNHYSSESDSDDGNNIIRYLSDVKNINSILYMKEPDSKKPVANTMPFKIIMSDDDSCSSNMSTVSELNSDVKKHSRQSKNIKNKNMQDKNMQDRNTQDKNMQDKNMQDRQEQSEREQNKQQEKREQNKQQGEREQDTHENKQDMHDKPEKDQDIISINIENIKSLKSLEEHTMDELNSYAKQMMITTFSKDNGARQELTKEELYEIIKENIINNI